MKTNVKKYLAWLPAVLIAAAIFCFSSQPGDESSELSGKLTKLIIYIAEYIHLIKLTPEQLLAFCEFLSTPIRKCAHITEFTALYISVLFALKAGGTEKKRRLLYALSITVIYAVSDEIHQIFVPGRAGMPTDVLIDSAGAAVLTLIFYLRYSRAEKNTRKNTAQAKIK